MSKLIRYNHFPLNLFRIDTFKKVKLREYYRQMDAGKRAFDFVLQEDGKIHPMEGEIFTTPNGMSLRPGGHSLGHILAHYKKKVGLVLIPEGTIVPKDLVLIHEHSDHYSLQTTNICTEEELNERINYFLDNTDGIVKVSLEDYFKQFPLMKLPPRRK
ncbi:hypothetical protein ABK040_000061 [Willaertia magna]